MDNYSNQDIPPIPKKSNKLNLKSLNAAFEILTKIKSYIILGFSFLVFGYYYFFREETPKPIKELNFLATDISECITLDKVSVVLSLNGEIPLSASIQKVIVKKFTKEEEMSDYEEINNGIYTFKLCKSSTETIEFHTMIGGHEDIYVNRFSSTNIPDTLYLNTQK